MASTKKNVCYCILDKKMKSTGNPSYEILVTWTSDNGRKLFKKIRFRNYAQFIPGHIKKIFNLSPLQKVTKIEEAYYLD